MKVRNTTLPGYAVLVVKSVSSTTKIELYEIYDIVQSIFEKISWTYAFLMSIEVLYVIDPLLSLLSIDSNSDEGHVF